MSFLSSFWKCGEEGIGNEARHQPIAELVAIGLLLEAEAQPPRRTVQLKVPGMLGDMFDGVVQEVRSLLLVQRVLEKVLQPVEHSLVLAVVVRVQTDAGKKKERTRLVRSERCGGRALDKFLGDVSFDIVPKFSISLFKYIKNNIFHANAPSSRHNSKIKNTSNCKFVSTVCMKRDWEPGYSSIRIG